MDMVFFLVNGEVVDEGSQKTIEIEARYFGESSLPRVGTVSFRDPEGETPRWDLLMFLCNPGFPC